MNPDRLAELEAEQRFLLRSLGDLEREHEAGDVDEVDYRALKDGYTVRAAATMRTISDGRSSLPQTPPANWKRRVIAGVSVVVTIGLVWWALVASSAERLPGQQITGLDPRDQRQTLMAQASLLTVDRPGDAAAIYDAVLALDPLDAEALTYRGWTLVLDARGLVDPDARVAQMQEALGSLRKAIETDPRYPDPQCFLGIVWYVDLQDARTALPYVDTCLASNPPAEVRGLVESLRVQIGDAIDQESNG